MRPLAEQSLAELGGRRSILHRQKRDHARLDELLDQLPVTSGEDRDVLVHRICRLVFTHAFAEEAVLWPALRHALDDGDDLTARVEREHQEITEMVAALERCSAHDPERQALVDRVVALLRQDVRDEEDVLLPRLQAAVDARTLRRLGTVWEVVRRTAPTRAHPIVSRRPPGQILSALPLSVADRLRDALDHLARRTSGRTRSALTAASTGLGSLTHRVEQLPPLRRGERFETRVSKEG